MLVLSIRSERTWPLSQAMRAAAHQRAAAATGPRSAAVAALRALLDSTLFGATRAAARLLLAELAAAVHVEPKRQAQQGAAEGAGLPRTRRRREQRRAARVRLASSGAAHGGGVVAGCKHDNQDKRPSLEDKVPQPQSLAAGGRVALELLPTQCHDITWLDLWPQAKPLNRQRPGFY